MRHAADLSGANAPRAVTRNARPAYLGLVLTLLCGCGGAPPPKPAAGAEAARATPTSLPIPRFESPLQADHPMVGNVIDTGARTAVPWEAMVATLSSAKAVLLGEKHDNPDHHALQASILVALAENGEAPALAAEMLDTDDQHRIDELLAAAPTRAAALAEAVRWQESGWPAFEMYAPVFDAALAAGAPILAGGLPRAQAMQLASKAEQRMSPETRAFRQRYGLDEPLPEPEAEALQQEMRDAHCGLLPVQMLPPMVEIQRTRDALLAEAVRQGIERAGRAVLIAGAAHVRKDGAAPRLLERIGIDSVRVVAFVEVEPDKLTVDAYATEHEAAFDYVVLTPRANDIDHCAELRARFEKH